MPEQNEQGRHFARFFSVLAPSKWNELPLDVHTVPGCLQTTQDRPLLKEPGLVQSVFILKFKKKMLKSAMLDFLTVLPVFRHIGFLTLVSDFF